jgi:hypothetical protein
MAHDASTSSTTEMTTSEAESGALTSVANPRRVRVA